MSGGEDMSQASTQPITATWSINLHAECPHCKEFVDLLTAPDFWDGRGLEVAETGTERSDNLDVYCPECGEEFTVECEY